MGDDNEIWKIMPGFEEYEISSIGRVRRNGKILNHPEKRMSMGYRRICFSKNGKLYRFSLHRAVAIAFIPNPENKQIVDHINADPSDCRASNLRWVTAEENNNNAKTRINAKFSSGTNTRASIRGADGKLHTCKPIVRISENGEKKIYQSAQDAEREGFSFRNISQCCHGFRRRHKGYRWEFLSYDDKHKKIVLIDDFQTSVVDDTMMTSDVFGKCAGISYEAGRIASLVTRSDIINVGEPNTECKDKMKEHIGNLMFYATALAGEFGLRLEDVLQYNSDKRCDVAKGVATDDERMCK